MALFLFDIDGTLLPPAGIGKRAFEKAVEDLYPGSPSGMRFACDGLLDPQIARRILEEMGREADAGSVDRILRRYLERLPAERPPSPESYRCPGVPEVLEAAESRGHGTCLLTGNIREGARMKLDFAGLRGRFQVGAYGDDAPTRGGLVAVAVERSRHHWSRSFTHWETWIVGDSPRDLAAAREGGVHCALVATGITPFEELVACAPDLLLRDLTDPEPLWRVSEGVRP